MDESKTSEKIAEEAIRFLHTHRLEPTPANYGFAYLYLTGTTSAMNKAVDEITDGGFRLTQAEVDQITMQVITKSGSSNDHVDEMSTLVRHQMLAVADLTMASLRDTRSHTHKQDSQTG